ncbi:hypothetical protein GCM10017673_30540 [Streptosporangium violaceochromogenes]|nr:hypothetical protein GCM10017673_30540 [Streptosporangium violaceochromogenes]
MNITRKTWVSAGVVGVILVGGVSVTAAASAGRIGADTGQGAGQGSGQGADRIPAAPEATGRPTGSPPSPQATSEPPQGSVVSRDLNPEPGHVARYWTEQRMREARPLPMPAVDGPATVNN